MKHKQFTDYMWVFSALYLALGLFNILFAWLGMICFITPLLIAIITGNKGYCHKYCGRGQLFAKLGAKFSRNKPMPVFLKSTAFRYGFLTFFMIMFCNMIFSTYLVFASAQTLQEVVTLLWTFKLPWNFTNTSFVAPWIAQYAFGFYSVMLTSTLIGVVVMILYKPRSFCVFCPMGTMTQGICKIKHKNEV